MRTKEIQLFKFAELSDSAKEKARSWYREASSGDSFWSECTIEDAKQCGEYLGLDVENVYWSGFWSQGDGACFEGSWNASKVKPGAMAEHAPQDKELHRIAAAFEAIASKYPEAGFTVKHRGHYSHENCTDFTVTLGDEADGGETVSQEEWSAAEDTMIEAGKDFMRWIYRQLEKEYEYQNADEQVDASIEANGYEFTEDGEID